MLHEARCCNGRIINLDVPRSCCCVKSSWAEILPVAAPTVKLLPVLGSGSLAGHMKGTWLDTPAVRSQVHLQTLQAACNAASAEVRGCNQVLHPVAALELPSFACRSQLFYEPSPLLCDGMQRV